MLEKTDNRRQRGNRLGGIEFQLGEHGTAQATSKESGLRDPRAPRGRGRKVSPGMKIERFFTRPGDDGFRGVEWDLRTAAIIGEGGKMVFEQRDVEVPKAWSQTATNVVVQKYFRGVSSARPSASARCVSSSRRVADTITAWGMKDGYFADQESARQLPRRAAPPARRSRRCPSTRRSGSTSASRPSRSARPASSTASRTPWSPSSRWPRPRACSSSTARAPAPTCRPCARRRSCWSAAAPPRARSAS